MTGPRPKPYQPSNGSEGDWFMGQWCFRCQKDTEKRPCGILGRAMGFDVTDKRYPRDWVSDADGGNPRCKKFVHDDVPRKRRIPGVIRDPRQIGMLL